MARRIRWLRPAFLTLLSRKGLLTSAPIHPRPRDDAASKYGEYVFGRVIPHAGRHGADLRELFATVVLTCTLLVVAPPIASAQAPIPINLESTPAGAAVYLDSTDSAPIGTTPARNVRVARGNHVLIFQLAGHQEFRSSVQVARARETFRAALVPLATLVITAGNPDAESAQVRIDGEFIGNVPYRGTATPGRHLVQAGRRGFVTFNQWVDVTAGQVLSIPVSLEAEAPSTGSILVAGDASGAAVFVDGTPQGTTPTVIENLAEGPHVVEVRPAGLPPSTETVTVVAGQRAVYSPTFRPTQQGGSLRVLCSIATAVIRVDGESVGAAPVTVDALSPGQHIVEAIADGYGAAMQAVTVEAGQQTVVSMELSRELGEIIVNASASGAVAIIDGQDRGTVPVVVRDADVGTHTIVIRAPGHEEYRTTCRVELDRGCEVNAQLVALAADPVPPPTDPNHPGTPVDPPEPGDRAMRREVVSRAAMPVPGDMTILDISAGWVYLFEARMGVGVYSFAEGEGGLLAGFGVRTFGRLTEFEGRFQVGYRPVRQISVGAALRLGGGIGPSRSPTAAERAVNPVAGSHPTNTMFMALEGIASLHFSQAGAFSIWLGADFYSDRWDWLANDHDTIDTARNGSRQKQARLRLGGSLEIVFSDLWNGWFLFEGVIASPAAPRAIFGDFFGTDRVGSELYLRLGVTRKFGVNPS